MTEQVPDRATLDKKDKGELSDIIAALGGRATSRMKKAELIDLVLELTSEVTASPSPTLFEGTDEPAPASAASAPVSSRRTPPSSSSRANDEGTAADDQTGTDRTDSRTRRPSSSASETKNAPAARSAASPTRSPRAGSEAGGNTERERTASSARSGSGRTDRGQGNSGTQSGQSGPSTQSSSDNGNGDRSARNQAGAGGASAQSTGAKSAGSGTGGSSSDTSAGTASSAGPATTDEADSGNRRRRRRGRGRDRDDIIDPVVNEPIEVSGFLDLREDGYGFLRVDGSLPSKDDVYVPVKTVRLFGLRKGDVVDGIARPANRNEKNPALSELVRINGNPAPLIGDDGAIDTIERPEFDDLRSTFPTEPFSMERPDVDPEIALTGRVVDLIAPVGKGQRVLVYAPPHAGKTTLLQQLAGGIQANHPEAELFVLLIDEIPEEVTEFASGLERGEVVASTFDRPAEEHTAVAELTVERAKRMAEAGHDVVVIVDGLTRLARAYNATVSPTGRQLPGGIDAGAIYPTKRLFGAGRNLDEAGSLTLIAAVDIENGTVGDASVVEELVGTATSEIYLDRLIAERGVFPAIDPVASHTREANRLVDADDQVVLSKIRELVHSADAEAPHRAGTLNALLSRLRSTASNQQFLEEIVTATSL